MIGVLFGILTFILSVIVILLVVDIKSRKREYEEHQKILDKKFERFENYREEYQKELEEEFSRRVVDLEEEQKQFSLRLKKYRDAEIEEIEEFIAEDRMRLMQEYAEEKEEIQKRLANLRSMEHAAIRARIDSYEDEHKQDAFVPQLTAEEKIEIAELESILPKLRPAVVEAIRRAMFEVYYRQPMREVIGRQTKNRRITGVYKITLITNGQCYIGQSVDIGNRWLEHARRGVGASEATGSPLYPAMRKFGLHNFAFEIIEEVEDDRLLEQEKYWADFFQSKSFGFNVRA